jgi:hypothetical protein
LRFADDEGGLFTTIGTEGTLILFAETFLCGGGKTPKSSRPFVGPVDLMKSAKSPMDSFTTLASLATGAFGLTRAPDLGADLDKSITSGFGERRAPIGDLGISAASLPKNVETLGELAAFWKKLATLGEPSGVPRGPKLPVLGSRGLSGMSYSY